METSSEKPLNHLVSTSLSRSFSSTGVVKVDVPMTGETIIRAEHTDHAGKKSRIFLI